jgi:hypothetical protein
MYLKTFDLHQIWRLETLQIMDHIPKGNWKSKLLYSCSNFSKIQFKEMSNHLGESFNYVFNV